jgi:K+-sensing histidine kinase KdpD
VSEIRFLEIAASITIGSIIMYIGVLLNEFILPNTSIVTLLFVIIAVIVANKIGKSLWNGLAAFILLFIFYFYFTKNFGEPEELMMDDLLIYQALIAVITTFVLDLLSKYKEKASSISS